MWLGEPSRASFDGWSVDGRVLDGEIAQSVATVEGPYATIEDLSLTVVGLPAMRAVAETTCSIDGGLTCTPDAASTFEVEGLGQFGVKGTWQLDETGAPVGTITLAGLDEIVLSFDDAAEGCASARIGASTLDDVCLGDLWRIDPLPDHPWTGANQVDIVSTTVATYDGALELIVVLEHAVGGVMAEVQIGGAGSELHPMWGSPPTLPFFYVVYTLHLVEGDYVPSQSTALGALSSLDEVAIKIRMFDCPTIR